MRDFNRLWRPLHLFLVVLAAALLTRIWLDSQNTLYNNGRWVSGKIGVYRYLLGGVAFLTSRVALSRNRLNPSAWHGCQKLLYKEPLDLRDLSVDFEIDKPTSLSVLYNAGPSGFSGVRLSRDPGFPNIRFDAAPDGRFTQMRFLPPLSLADGLHRAVLSFGRNLASLSLDGRQLAQWRVALLKKQSFGFWGGRANAPAYVDSVTARTASGRVLHEDFRNDRHAWPLFLALFALFLAPGIILRGGNWPARMSLALAPLCLGGALYLGYDFFLSSKLYPALPGRMNYYDRHDFWPALRPFYKHERAPFSPSEISASLEKRIKGRRKAFRILFIGTSQTWGSGAPGPGDSWVERIEGELNRRFKGNPPILALNSAVPGSLSNELLGYYERDWLKLRPRLVIVNLSNNDPIIPQLRANLEKILSLDKRAGIATAFVLEANLNPSVLASKHEMMRRLAARGGIPVFDLNGFLAKRRNSGFLWWDPVHLTLYGQELAADFLAPRIAGIVARLAQRRGLAGTAGTDSSLQFSQRKACSPQESQ